MWGCCVVAWCCVVLRGVAWCCVVLRGVAWCCVVLRGVAWCCVVLCGVAWCCVVLCGVAWCCVGCVCCVCCVLCAGVREEVEWGVDVGVWVCGCVDVEARLHSHTAHAQQVREPHAILSVLGSHVRQNTMPAKMITDTDRK